MKKYTSIESRLRHFVQLDKLKTLFLQDVNKYKEVVAFFPMACYVQGSNMSYIHTNDIMHQLLGYDEEAFDAGGFDLVKKHIHPQNMQLQKEWVQIFKSSPDMTQCLHYLQMISTKQDASFRIFYSYKKKIDENSFLTLTFLPGQSGKSHELFNEALGDIPFSLATFYRYQSLTTMEKEILFWISKGFTNTQMAERLFVSENTIRTHRNRIWKKLEIRHLREAIQYQEYFAYQIR